MNAERVEHEQGGASRQAIAQTASALSDAGVPETLSRILGIGPTVSDQLLLTRPFKADIPSCFRHPGLRLLTSRVFCRSYAKGVTSHSPGLRSYPGSSRRSSLGYPNGVVSRCAHLATKPRWGRGTRRGDP